MSPGNFPHLFSPIRLAGHTLKNRVVFASVYTGLARHGKVTPELQNFHVARAQGGVAAIVTEPFAMWRHQTAPVQVWIHGRNEKDLDNVRRLAAAIGHYGCHLIGQLQDPGRSHHGQGRRLYAVAPSALPDDLSWTVPVALERDEIRSMIDDFISSALKLQSTGFSGIEISGGHGHIFHQFMSPWMNHREDEYGGSFENRMRFLGELLDGLRAACGREFIIGLKLPGDDGIAGSISWQAAGQIAQWFSTKSAINYLTFVQGAHAPSLHMHVPDLHTDRGTYLEQIRSMKPYCGNVPLAAIGRIIEPAQSETVLESGAAELIMMGRSLIADAGWVKKAAEGRSHQIRMCVSGNTCWRVTNFGQPIACDNNPRIEKEQESDWWPDPAPNTTRVVVVGGGVAGLEAAWVAAARGHRTTLFASSAEPGGKLRWYSRLPGSDAMSSIADVQQVYGKKAGVEYRLSHRASAEEILSLNPEHVILATGAVMNWPTQLPRALQNAGVVPDLFSAVESVRHQKTRTHGTAVIYDFDGTDLVYTSAELLAKKFDRVVLLTPGEVIARDEGLLARQSAHKRLFRAGVEVITCSELDAEPRLDEGVVTYLNIMSGKRGSIENVVLLTYATPRTPDRRLAPALTDRGVTLRIIGDAYMPRPTFVAVREGHEAGFEIGSQVS